MATKRDVNITAIHVFARNEKLQKDMVNFFSGLEVNVNLPDEAVDWVKHMKCIPFPPDKVELNNEKGFIATWIFNTPICIESDEEYLDLTNKFLYLVRWECGKKGIGAQMGLELEYEEDQDTVLEVQWRWSAEPDFNIDKILADRAKYPLDYINEMDIADLY